MSNTPTYLTPHQPPLAWQKMGDRWCLVGQYGMRPIVLSSNPRGELMLRDAKTDRLVPFNPNHPDAKILAAAHANEATLIQGQVLVAQLVSSWGASDQSLTVAVNNLREWAGISA